MENNNFASDLIQGSNILFTFCNVITGQHLLLILNIILLLLGVINYFINWYTKFKENGYRKKTDELQNRSGNVRSAGR